jgi:hypothetical protein
LSVSGPLPTHFRWLWYLVGLAGMVLAVVGILAMLGSALDTGILVPFVVVVAVVIGGGVMWFRRSLDAAVAAAPSRQGGSGTADGAESDAEAGPAAAGADDGPPRTTPSKPPANPGRTSRRNP